jgi:protoporphyrinogen oxidase
MSAKVGVVGGGVLGLSLAFRLAELGHHVEIFEAAPQLGGLATWQDYGPFTWDRFYHCILPTDAHLIGLIRDLGLGGELVWRQTGTGYYARRRFHSMSRTSDYLKFPLLSMVDKARIGATVVYATLAADPMKLYGVSAQDWLTRWCGRRGYEVFWRPLLKAKFGPFYDKVAAVFIWATLTRLFGARSGAASKEKLGYVRGGYRAVLGRLQAAIEATGGVVHVGTPVSAIAEVGPLGARKCEITYGRNGSGGRRTFDQVFFTGPTRAARAVVGPSLLAHVERVEREHPAGQSYLGVACLVLALRRTLMPFYLLNVGEENVELTGVVEMTNLIDPDAQTAGLSLVYVPKYMGSDDPMFGADDREIERSLMDRGMKKIFPALAPDDIAYQGVHRAKFVQPLPLVGSQEDRRPHRSDRSEHTLTRGFQILNTSMLRCATLNNDEVVALAERFVDGVGASLGGAPEPRPVVLGHQVA